MNQWIRSVAPSSSLLPSTRSLPGYDIVRAWTGALYLTEVISVAISLAGALIGLTRSEESQDDTFEGVTEAWA
jgi:hypothetical protein